VRQRIKFEEINVVRELHPGLPPVWGDKIRLEQVFINLLINSADALAKGGTIIVRTSLKKQVIGEESVGRRAKDIFSPGEVTVIVEIEDTGTGIPKEIMERIFDPFFTTKDPQQGTGLGLSVTKSIIEMHHGLVRAESEPGKGTKMRLTLKIKEEQKA
jgi:two-component system cell cycle sensor histidine kinase/response regulator CckA